MAEFKVLRDSFSFISENPDLRITYKIDEENKFIIVYAAGSHKEAYKL